jgi:hypothetical protein
MNEPWATGIASGSFHLELRGWTAADLADSAQGALDFDWQNGSVQHLSLNRDGAPLRLRRFAGHAALRERRLQFQQGRLETPDGTYAVTGTASPGKLDLRLLDQNERGYAISGPLEKPRVTMLSPSEMQAAAGK